MKNIIKKLFFIGVIITSILLLFFIITCSWIGYEVKSQCQSAQRQYGKNCVESLISLLSDNNRSFRDRNSAIWALGQFGDNRALPTLQKYYTGNMPDREPLDKTISQYELKKAIHLTKGGFNISALIWRIGYNKGR